MKMKEQIKALYDQSLIREHGTDHNGNPMLKITIDQQKFAELIVAKVLDEVATRAYVSGDRAWSDDVDRQWIELEFGYGKLHDAKTFQS